MSETKIYTYIRPKAFNISEGMLKVTLEDERVISTPLYWYTWLAQASPEQQQRVEFLPDALYWTDLEEGLEIEGMLRGIRPAPAHYSKLTTEI